MRTTFRRPAVRRLQQLLLVGALAVFAAGCVTFNGATTATQTGSGDVPTTLRYTLSMCTNGAGFGGIAAGGPCAPSNPFGVPSSGRVIAAILVPVGSTAPEVVTATLSAPADVTRGGASASRSDLQAFRTTSIAADFNAQTPPPAGSTWVPYISELVTVPSSTPLSGDVTIDVTLPVDANGNPPANTVRQVSLADDTNPTVGGTDPTPGQTDTLTFDCYEPDADADGNPEIEQCADAFDPVAPQAVSIRRLTLTGAASAGVVAGASTTSNATLRLDGPALPSSTVGIATSYSGSGVTAAAADATAVAGSDVSVPVTLAAAASATAGTLTITATTSNGTVRTATVPVSVTQPAIVPPVVVPPALPADDGTRPTTTLAARRLANGKLRLTGTATDENRSAGLTSVKVQAVHGVGEGRCLAWNGAKVVNEPCTRSLARWITVPLTIATGTKSIDWSATTPVAAPGLWLLRARSADGSSLVSRVAVARVTVPAPRRKS